MVNGKKTVRSRRGQSEVVTTVILIAVVLVLAAVFIIIAMINFGRASASTSLSLAESFMTNVADDMEASMYSPGTVLVYPLPSTPYGVFNLISNYCNIRISVGNITYSSGALIYGVPPSYLSLPSGYKQVIRGSLTNGAYNVGNESTVIVNAAAPLISIVQFGAASVGGVSYGTYIVLFPRVLIISEPNTTYIYIPIINIISSGLRNTLVVNITSITSYTVYNQGGVTTNSTCRPLSSTISVNATTVRVVVINMTMTFR